MQEHRKDFSPIQLIGRKRFDEFAARHGMDDGVRTFSKAKMTDALLEALTLRLDSLREIEGVLGVSLSTLSNAMMGRCSGFFMDLCDEVLLVIRSKATSGKTKRALREVLALDSTEIDAHRSLFDVPAWARKYSNGRKASAKLHVV